GGAVLGTLPRGAPGPFELPPPRADDRGTRFAGPSPSVEIAAHYAEADRREAVDAARAQAAASARRRLEKLRRREEALRGDLERIASAEGRRRGADLLLAHLAEVPRGARTVTLPDDFADGAPVEIALDPARSAQENAQRLYREAKRLDRSRAAVAERVADTSR